MGGRLSAQRSNGDFRRVGMSAKRRLMVSVDGLWLCSGGLDQKKNHFFFWCVWVNFSIAGVIPDFGYCAEKREVTTGVRPIGLGVERQAQNGRVFVLPRALTPPPGG